MNAISVERARGFPARLRGLIARQSPLPGAGLLIERCRSVHTAFMRYAIDVVFLDAQARVLEIRERVLPWRAVICRRAMSVLELRSGEARAIGLHPGDAVVLLNKRPEPRPVVVRKSLPEKGAALVEFIIVAPLLLFAGLGVMQAALAFHAKSALNYAVFSAARAGSMDHARPAPIFAALARAMVPYYGGGSTLAELGRSFLAASTDFSKGAARLEILSPTSKSFDDFYSPQLGAKAGGVRAIPYMDIIHLKCPRDRPACAWDSATNSSGQSLQDANLLALRVTYGVPASKQMPIVGAFYTFALRHLGWGRDDAFVADLLQNGRIPIVARTTIRMISDAYEESAISYSGALQHAPGSGPAISGTLPNCPNWNSNCEAGSDHGGGSAQCNSRLDPSCLPRQCRPGDPSCDPNCGVRLCCTLSGSG